MKKRIMIVEDDFIIKLFVSRVISAQGYEVVAEASSSDQAIYLAENKSPDIILMDIGIDGNRDGIETMKIINQIKRIPVIYMTGNSDDATIERANATNPLGFIFKPIDELQLIKKLNDYFT